MMILYSYFIFFCYREHYKQLKAEFDTMKIREIEFREEGKNNLTPKKQK